LIGRAFLHGNLPDKLHLIKKERSPIFYGKLAPGGERTFSLNETVRKITPFLLQVGKQRNREKQEYLAYSK
jgi:hypothetical protein